MKKFLPTATLLLLTLAAFSTQLRTQQSNDEAQIKQVMTDQVAAWNRGDIDAFMTSYENSPETTFVGSKNTKGYETVLKHYKKNYSNKNEMGTLTFSDLEIRLLPASNGLVEYAVLTGHFHLDRTVHGAASKDDGYYSLVWHKTAAGWKIILDHTS